MNDESRQAFDAWFSIGPTEIEQEALNTGLRLLWSVSKITAYMTWLYKDAEIAALKDRINWWSQALEYEVLTKANLVDVNAICDERDRALARAEAAEKRVAELEKEKSAVAMMALAIDGELHAALKRLAAIDAEVGPEPTYDPNSFESVVACGAYYKHRNEQLASENVRLREGIATAMIELKGAGSGCSDKFKMVCIDSTHAILVRTIAANKVQS